MEIKRTVYEGEDREGTIDYLITDTSGHMSYCIYIFDIGLRGVQVRESHGLCAVDTVRGVAVACGIPSGGSLHATVRVSPMPTNTEWRVGSVCQDCCYLSREGL